MRKIGRSKGGSPAVYIDYGYCLSVSAQDNGLYVADWCGEDETAGKFPLPTQAECDGAAAALRRMQSVVVARDACAASRQTILNMYDELESDSRQRIEQLKTELDQVRTTGLRDLQDECYRVACEKGWHEEDEIPPTPVRMMTWMALLHSEVSEAVEDIRRNKIQTVCREDGKPEGMASELADVIIRALDTAGAMGFDMETEIRTKVDFNKTRSHKHGGKTV
ncbi:MAG: MazG nucleotide pyrophosphohydrolase domain-containing protein [Verrucomicrobiaceae bacterium]